MFHWLSEYLYIYIILYNYHVIFGEAFLELKGSKGMMLHFPKKMRSSSEPQNPQNHRVDFCEMSAF